MSKHIRAKILLFVFILSTSYLFGFEIDSQIVKKIGDIFISANIYENRLNIYNKNGEKVDSVGGFGKGPGEFSKGAPSIFAISDKYLVCADNMERKIVVFDRNFQYFKDIKYNDIDFSLIWYILSNNENFFIAGSQLDIANGKMLLTYKIVKVSIESGESAIIYEAEPTEYKPFQLNLSMIKISPTIIKNFIFIPETNGSIIVKNIITGEITNKINISDKFKVNKEFKNYYEKQLSEMPEVTFKIKYPKFINPIRMIFSDNLNLYISLWKDFLSDDKIILKFNSETHNKEMIKFKIPVDKILFIENDTIYYYTEYNDKIFLEHTKF